MTETDPQGKYLNPDNKRRPPEGPPRPSRRRPRPSKGGPGSTATLSGERPAEPSQKKG